MLLRDYHIMMYVYDVYGCDTLVEFETSQRYRDSNWKREIEILQTCRYLAIVFLYYQIRRYEILVETLAKRTNLRTICILLRRAYGLLRIAEKVETEVKKTETDWRDLTKIKACAIATV